MSSESVPTLVGTVVVNLQAIEMVLRLFLNDDLGPRDPSFQFNAVAVGDTVAETPLTNYDSLDKLIKKVNHRLAQHNLSGRVDPSLVDLRDALAHGRLLADNPSGPFRLFKFSPPAQGSVQVTTAIDMTPDWLTAQVRRTFSEVRKIYGFGRSLGLPSLST